VVRLPAGAETFAVSEQCPLAGFVLGDALALQGHPEFSKSYAGELMDARRTLLGEALHDAGKASLRQRTDAPLVARWMLRFMSRDGR
jgi:GMP synthase (glutamine-hydrolysing)